MAARIRMARRSPYARLLAAALAAWGAGHAGSFVGGPVWRFAGKPGPRKRRLPLQAEAGEVADVPPEATPRASRRPKLKSPYSEDTVQLNEALQDLYRRPLTKGELSYSMPPLLDAARELLGREPRIGDIHVRYQVTIVGLGGEVNQQAFWGPFAASEEEAASGVAKEAGAWLGLPDVTHLQGLATGVYATWGNGTQVWARIGEVSLELPGKEGRQTYTYVALVQAAVEAKRQAGKQAAASPPRAKNNATKVSKTVKAKAAAEVEAPHEALEAAVTGIGVAEAERTLDPEEVRIKEALVRLFDTPVPRGTDLWSNNYFNYAAQVWLKRTMRKGDWAVRGKLTIRNESSDTTEVYVSAFTDTLAKAKDRAADMFLKVQSLRDPGSLPETVTTDARKRLAEYIELKKELSAQFRPAEIKLKPDQGEPVVFDPLGLLDAAASILQSAKRGAGETARQGAPTVPSKRRKTPAADKAAAEAAVHAEAVRVS